MLNVEYQVNRDVARCLCKIAFNYVALICGNTFALSSDYDDMREFFAMMLAMRRGAYL